MKGPSGGYTNVALTKKIRLVEIPHDATVEKIIQDVPGLYKEFLPPDLYGKNQVNEGPIPTLGMASIFATRADMPDDLVYKVTKALFENLSEFHKCHSQAKDIQLETALKNMPIPLHPGAEKYYKEKGILK